MSLENGLKIAICQMNVVPGRPDINTDYMAEEIRRATERGMDIILFPELCTTGYFIGDQFENDTFIKAVIENHKKVREATQGGITAIFGSIVPDATGITGENGFPRIFNSAVVYSNGSYAGRAIKTLLPNYRMFDDDRHFCSGRKLAAERGLPISEILKPIEITTKSGQAVRLGVTLCEDIWDENYPISPVGILTANGADIICNLSASPWTWQKNRKRHEVVRKFSDCGVPLIYVNNTGIQNIGKNIIVFDGCSTVYNRNGLPVFEVGAYKEGTFDLEYNEDLSEIPGVPADDSKELFNAASTGVKEFFKNIPPNNRKVVIGLSGGIDSATAAALYTNCLGKENVIGINMPMPASNAKLQIAANDLAANLGIKYEIVPIKEIAELKTKLLNIEDGSLAHENMLARTRMDILATRAQQVGGFFTANFNKVEQAFGYGTLGGDMEGFLAVLGDMVKREVYQLADYMNREVYRREVIPQTSFDEAPTADLKVGQRDPFDYGNTKRRGYHDEMVRAFTEFKRDPEWFLERYKGGDLESELLLDPGTLKRLFPTGLRFVADLEKHWDLYYRSYFKRIQAPPVLIVSRRSFGGDLRESMIPAYITQKYARLKEDLLNETKNKILIYGGSFNPPSLHHCQIAAKFAEQFDRVIIVPCGFRADKKSSGIISPADRSELVNRAFGKIPNVSIDNSDLTNDTFTPAYVLDERYKKEFRDKEIWHIIGGDLIEFGSEGRSEIQLKWQKGPEVWNGLNFFVVMRTGVKVSDADLPPNSVLIPDIGSLFGSSTMIRERIAEGQEIENILLPEVWEYIKEKELYGYQKNGGQK